jgi:hypothetical protein
MRTGSVKEAVIELIQRLPADVSVADIMAALDFHRKIDEGLRQLDDGQGVPHTEAKDRFLAPWLA